MKKVRSIICLILICTVFSVLIPMNCFASTEDLKEIITDTAQYVYSQVQKPQIGSIGGEWAIIGLSRSGYKIPDSYYQDYYNDTEKYVKACNGVIDEKKYTEYSRLIIALTAIGKNPSDVSGYNLLTPLGDYEKTIRQGLNGAIWALIAIDSGNYEIPENPDANVQSTRNMYVDRILNSQNTDGSWSLTENSNTEFDSDLTGMAVQALSKYQYREDVKKSTDRALECISENQNSNGGFSSRGIENSESDVQILNALCELGISFNDERFVKNGKTLIDSLMSYYVKGGGFRHTHDEIIPNEMASEQGLCGITSAYRFINGMSGIYKIDDAHVIPEAEASVNTKNKDIKIMNIIHPNKTFSDVQGHKNQEAIERLAERGIINGKTDEAFEPDSTMTRAEFACIIVRGLGLNISGDKVFDDVNTDDWFYDCVSAAYNYKIVTGTSDTEFNPNGTITHEEAAVMITRAAVLCGEEAESDKASIKDILAGFTDYTKVSDWAASMVAFCCINNIIDNNETELKPKQPITRAEVAQLLFNMLKFVGLINM